MCINQAYQGYSQPYNQQKRPIMPGACKHMTGHTFQSQRIAGHRHFRGSPRSHRGLRMPATEASRRRQIEADPLAHMGAGADVSCGISSALVKT
jgi:hypothetical protein